MTNTLTTDLCNLKDKRIILASQSPRRHHVLRMIGIEFEIVPSEIEEAPAEYADAIEYTRGTALSKLNWVWQRTEADLVIAADTIVVKDGEILEKPKNRDDAVHKLQTLAGTTHEVVTVICLRSKFEEIVDHELSQVRFYPMTEDEIRTYVATGETDDKAGAYGIQGAGAIFIKDIQGCYFNVMGFPIGKFYHHLREMKI